MRIRILLLLLLSTTLLFGQKTKKIKENAGYGKAKFYVLESDGITKHGEYKIISYTPPFRKIVKGNYSNGKREGLWVEKYDKSGKKVRFQGTYSNGEKIGKWNYYDSKGSLTQTFDFDKNEFTTNSECGGNNNYEVEVNGEIENKKLTCPPTRIGGIRFFTKDLFREITKKLPFEINSSGRTTINIDEKLSFFITKEGIIESIQYSGREKNKELAKVIDNYLLDNKSNWISGKINNEKIKAKIIIPIRIRMMF